MRPDAAGELDSMQQAVERGAALTRQLLAFSRAARWRRRRSTSRRLLGMRELLQRSLRGESRSKMSFDEAPLPVEVDPGELELAILNLCVNSRDAMPAAARFDIGARLPADSVTISVADTGVG